MFETSIEDIAAAMNESNEDELFANENVDNSDSPRIMSFSFGNSDFYSQRYYEC
jgi:hypothetical protein